MKKPPIIFLGLIATLVLCLIALSQRGKSNSSDHSAEDRLTLYCAAGLRNPVSKIIDQYTRETGRKVTVIYSGSGTLLSQIQLAKGDLYLPADLSYVKEAQGLGLAGDETIPVGILTAKIIVSRENASIQSLEDLAKPGVRISFANKSAAIGKFTREILAKNGLLEKIEANVIVTKPTVNNIIEDVALGSADATIAWGAVAQNFPNVRTIEVPIFTAEKREACITVLSTSKDPARAKHLILYMSANDKGLKIFKSYGFETPSPTKKEKVLPKTSL